MDVIAVQSVCLYLSKDLGRPPSVISQTCRDSPKNMSRSILEKTGIILERNNGAVLLP